MEKRKMIKPEDKFVKAIIYSRVSTEDQVKNYSLGNQEQVCREYATRNSMEVIKIFVEEGESAKFISRTKLAELIDYCKKNSGLIDVLIVYKLDRLARSQQDHQAIRAILSQNNVALRSATEPIDETSTGKLMEGILSSFAQFDNDVRAERVTSGMKERLKQGYWAFVAPVGYKHVLNGEIHNIAPDENKATLVVKAFEEYSKGIYNLNQLAERINRWGLRTRLGKKFTKQATLELLRNNLYCGIISVPRWEIESKGKFEPIVSEELFYKVQQVRLGKGFVQETRLRMNPDFVLRGSLTCPECQKPLTGSWSKGKSKYYAYYHCVTKSCNLKSLPKEPVEKSFIQLLKSIEPTEEYIKLFKEAVRDIWKRQYNEKFKKVKRIEFELVQIRELKDSLIDTMASEKEYKSDIKERIKKLNEEITYKEMSRNEARDDETSLEYIISLSETLLNNVSTIWLDSPMEHKVRFQQMLFPKGVIYKNGIIGTPELGLPFKVIQDSYVDKSNLVNHVNLAWNSLLQVMRDYRFISTLTSFEANLQPKTSYQALLES